MHDGGHDDHHDGPHESRPADPGADRDPRRAVGDGRVPQRHAARRAVGALQGLRRAAIGGGRDRGLHHRHRARRVDRTARSDGGRTGRAGRRRGRASEEDLATGCGFETPEPGTVCFIPTQNHAESTFSKIAALARSWSPAPRHRHRRSASPSTLAGTAARRAHRALAGLRGGYLFLDNKYYLDALYERRHRPCHRPPDRQGRQLVQPERHRRRSSTASGTAAKQTRRRGSTATSTNASSTARSTAPAPSPPRAGHGAATRAVRQGQPVRCAALRRGGRRRHRARHRQRAEGLEIHGHHHRSELAAERRHVPADARRAGDAVHPARGRGARTSRSPSSPPVPRSPSASSRSSSSTTTSREQAAVLRQRASGSRSSTPTTRSVSTASACRCTCCRWLHHLPRDDLHVGQHARGRATRRRSSS